MREGCLKVATVYLTVPQPRLTFCLFCLSFDDAWTSFPSFDDDDWTSFPFSGDDAWTSFPYLSRKNVVPDPDPDLSTDLLRVYVLNLPQQRKQKERHQRIVCDPPPRHHHHHHHHCWKKNCRTDRNMFKTIKKKISISGWKNHGATGDKADFYSHHCRYHSLSQSYHWVIPVYCDTEIVDGLSLLS